jgi:prepilin-type processing-associated H-X9-DG protein
LKQLGLALMNYHFTHGFFPHGTYNRIDETGYTQPPYNGMQDRRCWMQDILPFLEQENLFREFDTYMSSHPSALWFPLNTTIVPTLMCPDDPTNPKLKTWNPGGGPDNSQGFSGNYVLCAGDDYFNPEPIGIPASTNLDGMFYALSKVRLSEVTDGTSNTAMSSELILSPDVIDNDIRGRYYNPAHCGTLFSTRLPPNTMVPDELDWCSKQPVPQAPCEWRSTNIFVLARSYHPGGVNLGLVDGSVRFIANSVNPVTYKALGSRNGNEVLGDF